MEDVQALTFSPNVTAASLGIIQKDIESCGCQILHQPSPLSWQTVQISVRDVFAKFDALLFCEIFLILLHQIT